MENDNTIDIPDVPVEDLSSMSSNEQGELLRRLERQARGKNVTERRLFILQGTARDMMDQLASATIGLHDIDGTHTDVGGFRLRPTSIVELQSLMDAGARHFAVTGRHQWQADEIIRNHPENPLFDAWLFEQGFFIRRSDGTIENFEGTEAIAHHVDRVRQAIESHLVAIGSSHGVTFEQTSIHGEGGAPYPHAHQTMYSIDALSNGRKIDDPHLHGLLAGDLARLWHDHAVAKQGSSSTGTFEWTPDGLNKAGAIRRLLAELRADASSAVYLGDSGNDVPVFKHLPELAARVAIVNPHTSDHLIANATIATVGIANAWPFLRVWKEARTLATTQDTSGQGVARVAS